MSRRGRLVLKILAVLAAVFVIAAIALPFLVDADALRAKAEAKLTEMSGRRVKLGRAHVSLWTGLLVTSESVTIGEPVDGRAEGVPVVDAGPTSIRLEVWPFLHREVVARAVVVDGATVRKDGKPLLSDINLRSALRLGADRCVDTAGRVEARIDLLPARPPVDARFDTRYAQGAVEIRSLDATVGPARIKAKGRVTGVSTPSTAAQADVEVSLGRSSLTGPLAVELGGAHATARFDMTSPRLDLSELAGFPSVLAGTKPPAVPAGIEMTDVRAKLTATGEEVRLDDATYAAFGGKGAGKVAAHPFESARPFSLDQHVEGVSIGALIGAFAPAEKGSVEGTAALNVALQGRAGESALLPTLSGKGSLAIRNGSIKSVGVIQQVMGMLEAAGAKGFKKSETPFERLTADFDVARGVATTQNLQFRSADLDFDGKGTVGLGGALALDVVASFSQAVTSQLVAKTHALSIRVDDQGRLTVPLQIRGTLQAPRVQLDLDKVIKESVTKELKKDGTKSLLKKLFGR